MNIKINKIFFGLGIQGKLTLIFILLSTIPLILVSIYTVEQQIKFKKDENIREMTSDVKGFKERTTLFLTRVESETMLVMKSTELKKLLNNLSRNIKIDSRLQQNAEKEFMNIVTDNNFYLKIELLDKKGKEILCIMNGDEPYAVTKENLSKYSKNYYVQIAKRLRPGEIELSPSEVESPNSGTFVPIIDFILPIHDEKDNLSAIVTVNIYAEEFFKLLVPSYGLLSKKIFIVNGEGYFIYNSERKNNWNSLFTDRFDENLYSEYSEEIASKILNGKSKSILNYKERIIQYSPIFSGSKAGTDRYFIIEDVDADVIMSSADNQKILLTILIVIAGIASLIAGILTARKFLMPIKQLIKGTKIIRDGNLDYKLSITTHDEIQSLIDNFNQLVMEWKQKQMLEKEIRKSEKLFSSLTQTATDAILEIDGNGIVKIWNDSAARIFGFKKEEILGKNIFNSIVPKKYQPFAKLKLNQFLADRSTSEKGQIIEVNALRKDGTEFPAELSISKVIIDGSHYVTGIIRDITQRKEMLEELIEAKDKAEISYKLKTEFLNQMSHEIRTPLNVLLNVSEYIYSNLKERELLDEDTNQHLFEIKESAARIIRTVELILNVSQVQTGSYENNPRQIDIFKDVLSRLYSVYQTAALQKGIDFKLIRKNEDAILYADPYSMEQVFNHLIDNAIKFTNSGNVIIEIDKNEMNKVVISIKDTGIGMSEKYTSKIFDLFSQERHGLSRAYDGNGLGLTLVKKLCEMNNVLIEVHSVENNGSKFTLTFPQTDLVLS